MSEQTTGLTVFDRITDPLDWCQKMGEQLAKSGLVGAENIPQGQVLALACLVEKTNPLDIARRYYIMDGKLTKKADAMLAEFRGRGGKVKILQRDSEAAHVVMTLEDETVEFKETFKEMEQERYIYDKNNNLRPNWATPRGRRLMLWARVISEGTRVMCPEIVAGTYTPEEIEDIRDAPKITQVEPAKPAVTSTSDLPMPEPPAPANDPPKTEAPANGVEDAEFEPKKEEGPALCSQEQKEQIKSLLGALQPTQEQIDKALGRYGVKVIRELTAEQAANWIEGLTNKVSEPAADQPSDADRYAAETDGPITAEMVEEIKSHFKGDHDSTKALGDWLHKNDKQKLAELTRTEGVQLLEAIQLKQLEAFFGKE